MAPACIRVMNVSKRYRISLADEQEGIRKNPVLRMLSQPLVNFGQLRRMLTFADNEDAPDVLWALRDVSFDVEHGEVLGIIGRNGSGKSTLLKIITGITPPTYGRIEIQGRLSSLLGVGAGFHPELTGKENVYLSGNILGMKRADITRKFAEIVAFSELEQFIYTPVKRYSTGMRARLAFAVAAHLEPEILVLDEALATGDVAFREKCVQKMRMVASEGRTVVIVSHMLPVLPKLTPRCIWIHHGRVMEDGESHEVIRNYLQAVQGEHPI